MTFQEAYTAVLDYVNRPSQEMLVRAKREVNYACEFINRNEDFVYANTLKEGEYPANQLSAAFSTVLEAGAPDVFSITTIQKLVVAGDPVGSSVRIVGYEQIQEFRRKHTTLDPSTDIQNLGPAGIVAYFVNGGLGLYPRPSSAVPLLIQYKQKIAALSGDSDTNFILDYMPDLVLTRAVMQFAYYLKDPELANMFTAKFQNEWEKAIAWNLSIKERVINSF